MTNNEFMVKLNTMFKKHLPIAKQPISVNELVYVLKHDKEVEDYNVNISSASKGFNFGMVKDTFYPSWLLGLQINSIEYEEDEDSPYPVLMIKTN